ncbi:MAG: hypothetical protein GY788_04860 [bacterium]|nr:hypothetical protein [bacterium]
MHRARRIAHSLLLADIGRIGPRRVVEDDDMSGDDAERTRNLGYAVTALTRLNRFGDDFRRIRGFLGTGRLKLLDLFWSI